MARPTRQNLQHTEQVMHAIGDAVKDTCPGMGFVVLVFNFGETGVANYISNVSREDCVKVLRESATRLEFRLDHPPGTDPRVFDDN
jgi:hypothetical protein